MPKNSLQVLFWRNFWIGCFMYSSPILLASSASFIVTKQVFSSFLNKYELEIYKKRKKYANLSISDCVYENKSNFPYRIKVNNDIFSKIPPYK